MTKRRSNSSIGREPGTAVFTQGLSESLLRTCLRAALRSVPVRHRVAVHDVEGRAPGLYRWPYLSAPVRSCAMRDELYRVSLDQGLAHDAAFVVIAAACVGARIREQANQPGPEVVGSKRHTTSVSAWSMCRYSFTSTPVRMSCSLSGSPLCRPIEDGAGCAVIGER